MSPSSDDRYIEVAGAQLRYRDSAVGPAVVLVHGWTLDLDVWGPQELSLSEAFRIIRMDRRGYGLSGGRPSLQQDVKDVTELLRHLGVQRFALVGMSQGARIALKLTHLMPERVRALILDGPPFIEAAPPGMPPEIPYDQYRAIAVTKGMPVFRREWRKHALTRLHTQNPEMRELLDTILERYRGNDLTDSGPPQAFPIDLQQIAGSAVPTLILSGEFDLPTRQQSAQWLAEHLSGSIRQEIPNAGHLSGLDNPSAYNRAVKDFLIQHATGQ
jgi:pimeloyl-ACP methyl ester carboxylesterase